MVGSIASQDAPSLGTGRPGALIRTLDGYITYWSPDMESRYGYAPEEAVGKVAHTLLRTTSWRALDEIEAILVSQDTWRGGLIHYRADSQPVIASNHWHLHYQPQGQAPLVTELHSDIVPPGTPLGSDLADIIAAMAHQLSEPLTAVGAYVSAAHRDLQPAWPDKMRASQAIDRAVQQLKRAREILDRMRALGAKLRDRQQIELHENLMATMRQTAYTIQAGVRTAALGAAVARLGYWRRYQTTRSDEQSLARTIALQNIRLFQRLLNQDGHGKLDTRIREMVAQLLSNEEAKLATLEL